MKTSNIILTVIVGSVTFLLVTGILQNRYLSRNYASGQTDYNLESRAVDLPTFKYLVIRNESNVEIISPGKNQMILRYEKGKEAPENAYHVSGDTLYIGSTGDSLRNTVYTQLSLPVMDHPLIKGINSHFRFSGFSSPCLAIILDNSEADLSNGQGKGLHTLSVNGFNGSRINSDTFHVDSLQLQLNDSKAYIPVTTDDLSGSIKNHSELNIKDVAHFDFTRDESSRLSHWN